MLCCFNPDYHRGLFLATNRQSEVFSEVVGDAEILLIVATLMRWMWARLVIHQQLLEQRAAKNKAIVLVSVELEVVKLADRILVMFEEHVVGSREPATTERQLGLMMAGLAGGNVG